MNLNCLFQAIWSIFTKGGYSILDIICTCAVHRSLYLPPTYIAENTDVELAGTGVDSEIDGGVQEEGTQDDKVVEIRTDQTNYPGINERMNE